MSELNISKLTPEQEALIPVYREKWKDIAFSTEKIDKYTAREAITWINWDIPPEDFAIQT